MEMLVKQWPLDLYSAICRLHDEAAGEGRAVRAAVHPHLSSRYLASALGSFEFSYDRGDREESD
jgi:hypothetical protein